MGLNHIVLLVAHEKTMSERIETALLNTVMGIVIVFVVLLLISAIISCFRFIHQFELKMQRRKEEKVQKESAAQIDNVIETITQHEEEELRDDLELVAVITAAIHAYEEASGNDIPANGLFVRSIKKVNKAKWLNA